MREKKTMGRNAQAACVNYTACQSKWDLELNTAPRVKTAWQCVPCSGKNACIYNSAVLGAAVCGKSLRNSPKCVNVLEESQRGLTSMRQRRPQPITPSFKLCSFRPLQLQDCIEFIIFFILAPHENAKHHLYMVHGTFLPETFSWIFV